jgi:hypothetical protein
LRRAATLFLAWHGAAVLVTGAAPSIKDPLWPLFGWYGEGLAMTNTWGMFGKPPRVDEVLVIAKQRDGTSYELSTNWTSERDIVARIFDARLRKIQTQVVEDELRPRLAEHFLRYFCRSATERDPSVTSVELRLVQPPGGSDPLPPGTHSILERRCDGEPG